MDLKEIDLRQEIKNFFAPDGLLSKYKANYEYRESQEKMALAVLNSLENRTHLFVEAPTGVGKSFAYLIPAIYYAKKYGKKAVISTHTINLQEQLLHKDIPFLEKVLPVEFKASLIKGKGNYLCPKRLNRALDGANTLFEAPEQMVLEKINSWSKTTTDGTLSDVNFYVPSQVWSEVCSESGVCTNAACGKPSDTDCWYQKAKYEVQTADVVIINHHLFFSLFDGFASEEQEGYLFLNDFVVFDEAHTIEDIAATNTAPSVSREEIKFYLLKLYNDRKRKGFLLTFPAALHLLPMVASLTEQVNTFFADVRDKLFVMHNGKIEKFAVRVFAEETSRIKNTLKDEFNELIKKLRELRKTATNEMQENELTEYIARLTDFNFALDKFMEQSHKTEDGSPYVYWAEVKSAKDDANIALNASPVDISDFFRKYVFKQYSSSILTSATLTVNNNFSYFKKRLGGEQTKDLKLSSPFDFYKQAKIFIPRNIPPPDKEGSVEYEKQLTNWIKHFVTFTQGKALVLFTNMRLMKKAGDIIKDDLQQNDINLYMQGAGTSRTKLLSMFSEDVNSVLFGVDSFWMGVDVPGEALSNLIITKLPFQVPSHPLMQAKMEWIEANGGNSFMEYSLPEAILKFRQGVGRLIRSKEDSGIIVILDSRILTKFYGKSFINSLEQCKIEIVQ